MHNAHSTDGFTLWTSQHFMIEQCWSCPVPGYGIDGLMGHLKIAFAQAPQIG